MITTTQYDLWIDEVLPTYLAEELGQIKGNEKEIEDRFYRTLPLGTGGMRGELGVGTNRMNIYTIRLAAAGLAQHIVVLVSKRWHKVLLLHTIRGISQRTLPRKLLKCLAHTTLKVTYLVSRDQRRSYLLQYATSKL